MSQELRRWNIDHNHRRSTFIVELFEQNNDPATLHSDGGAQFTSHSFQPFLKDNHIGSSMSSVGGYADNAGFDGGSLTDDSNVKESNPATTDHE